MNHIKYGLDMNLNLNTMTKEEFKIRWESNEEGGGITFNEIAKCAISWGVNSKPKISPIDKVLYQVLKAANTIDCEEYKPLY